MIKVYHAFYIQYNSLLSEGMTLNWNTQNVGILAF